MMRSARGILWIFLGTLGLLQGQALTGVVRSAEEGPLEGVLVSAQRVNTPVTITVVSDEKGGFSFPAAKLSRARHNFSLARFARAHPTQEARR